MQTHKQHKQTNKNEKLKAKTKNPKHQLQVKKRVEAVLMEEQIQREK